MVIGGALEDGGDFVAIRRVANDEHFLLAGSIDDEGVEDGAALVTAARVERLTDCEPGDVVRDLVVDDRDGEFAAEEKLPHMADVEDARGGADRLVLVDDPRVLNRHFPTGEGDHPSVKLDVLLVERRAAK